MLRRGSSSKKKESAKEPVSGEEMDLNSPVLDKKAAKKKAADEKAAQKKAAKEKAAEEKAAKKAGGKKAKEPKVKPSRAEKRPAGPKGVLVRRPKTSIYSVMLMISAAALAVGCLMLVLEIWTYGPPWTFPWNIPINLRQR